MKRLFTPLDLVAPIGVCSLSAALCLWGMLSSGNPVVARIICGVVGFAFLTLIGVWFWARWKFVKRLGYITQHNVAVVVGKVNNPTKDVVENWTTRLIALWAKNEYRTVENITKMVKGVWVEFSDHHMITIRWKSEVGWMERVVYGYAKGKQIAVGSPKDWTTGDAWVYVNNLFDHEMSHAILCQIHPKYWKENVAHIRMAQIGI